MSKSDNVPPPAGYTQFDNLMRGLVAVPKEELDKEIARERKEKKGEKRPRPSKKK